MFLCKIIPLIPILQVKNTPLIPFLSMQEFARFSISANLHRGDRRGVWFHVLYDVLRKHNRDRDEDRLLSCKDSLWSYVDRAWQLFELHCLLFERFDSLQICFIYGRNGVVEPVGNSDKSLCVEWLFGISELLVQDPALRRQK